MPASNPLIGQQALLPSNDKPLLLNSSTGTTNAEYRDSMKETTVSASCSRIVYTPCALLPLVNKHQKALDQRIDLSLNLNLSLDHRTSTNPCPYSRTSTTPCLSMCYCDSCTNEHCRTMSTTTFHTNMLPHQYSCASSSHGPNSVMYCSSTTELPQGHVNTLVIPARDDNLSQSHIIAASDPELVIPTSSTQMASRCSRRAYSARYNSAVLISLLLFALCGTSAVAGTPATIPGCADIDNLEASFNFQTSSLNDLLLCFCKVNNDSNVAISCLYGSSLDDLVKAMSLVIAANATVDEIALSHVEFNQTGLPQDFFTKHAPNLRSLSIGYCTQTGPLTVQQGALHGLESTLKEVALTDCNIETVPDALNSLSSLLTLSMARNKITHIDKNHMAVHKNLESLNLAGNFLNSMEEGTLSQLKDSLKTLILGEHNFINESIMREITQLNNLKVLDLSKADGINELSEGMFERLDQLQKLLLMGCSLTAIRDQSLRGLESLEELDLRINLIREVDCAAFKWLPNIRRLSLAGNYVNSSDSCVWQQLPSIQDLDLSWNELGEVPSDAFAQLGATLEILNLRHNSNLSQIDENGFRNLTHLRRLNLSETSMAEIEDSFFVPLTSLEALDLSNAQVESMAKNSLMAQKTSLKELTLAGNRLRTLPDQLIGSLSALQLLDLSSNPWLCDDKIKSVVGEVNAHYTRAAQMSEEFMLENANRTTCDRPYSVRGEVITDVDDKLLVAYDMAADTTTPKPTTMPTTVNHIDQEQSTPLPFTFFPDVGVVGEESKEGLDHSQTATRAPPEYDINAKQTLNDGSDSKVAATLIAIAIMLLVSVAVTFAVVVYVKRRKSENTDAVGDTELNMRSTYEVKKPNEQHFEER